MARFVVLKGGASYKVFEFDGNIARVGSGETMDLDLEAPGLDGDLFFLTKTPRGYEIERRNDSLSFNVNGAAAGNRVFLNDGDKVTFLDYIIVATYPPTLGAPVVEPAQSQPAPVAEEPRKSKDTSPVAAAPIAPPPPPKVDPPKPVQRGPEKATTIIDSAAMAQAGRPSQPQPPAPSQRETREPSPRAAQPETPRAEKAAAQQARKPRITPVYSLVGLAGQYKGQVREIDTREFVVGRDGSTCELVVDRTEGGDLDNSVSREHFTIHSTDEGLFLIDKKSRLRTYINGKVLEQNQRESIAPEDVISIPVPRGEVKFRLCFVGNENFAPDKGRSKYLPMIIGLALIITLLIVAAIWLLGD
ncbi:MAG: FHA domain-containing protein [Candidatus Zixiibacteriota bacterium]